MPRGAQSVRFTRDLQGTNGLRAGIRPDSSPERMSGYQSQPRMNNAMMMMGSGNPSSQAARPYRNLPARGCSGVLFIEHFGVGRFMA
jgi:hypothetical protein